MAYNRVGGVSVDVQLDWSRERRKLDRELKSIERHYKRNPVSIDVTLNLRNPSDQIEKARAQMQKRLGSIETKVYAKLDDTSAYNARERLERIMAGLDTEFSPRINRAAAKKAKEQLENAVSGAEARIETNVAASSVAKARRRIATGVRGIEATISIDAKRAMAEAVAARFGIESILGTRLEIKADTDGMSRAISRAVHEAEVLEPRFVPGSLEGLKRTFQRVMPGQPMWVWPQVNWKRWRQDWDRLRTTWANEAGSLGRKIAAMLQRTVGGDVWSKTANVMSTAIRGQKADLKSLANYADKVYRTIGDSSQSTVRKLARDFRSGLRKALDPSTLGDRLKLTFTASWEWEKAAYKAYQELGLQKFMRWKLQVKVEAAKAALAKFAAYAKRTLAGAFIFGGSAMVVSEILNFLGDIKQAFKDMAPAAGAVAGSMAAFAAGAAVMRVAFDDIKVTLADLEEPLARLRDSIKDAFWGGGVKESTVAQISGLADHLTLQLQMLSGTMSRVFSGFLAAVTGSEGKIRQIIVSATEGFEPMAGAVGNATRALFNMLAAGSTFFPQFTGWLDEMAAKWLEWTAQTDLVKWIGDGLQAAKDFGAVVGNLFGLMGDVMSAAAQGGIGMAGFADQLRAIREHIASPEMQSGMSAFFTGVHAGSAAVGSAIGGVISKIMEMGDTFGPLVQHVGEAMGNIVNQLGAAFTNPAVIGGIDTLVQAFNNVVSAAGPAFGQFMESVATALGAVAANVSSLSPQLGQAAGLFAELGGVVFRNIADLANGLLPPLLDVVNALMPSFNDLTANLLPILVEMATSVGKPLADLAKTVLPPILDVITQLLPKLEPMASRIITPIAEAISALAPYVADIVADLLPAAVSFLEGLVAGIAPVLDLLKYIAPVIGTVASWIAKLLNFLSPVLRVVGEFVGMNLGFGLLGKAVSAVGSAFGKLFEWLKGLGGIGGKIGQMLESVGAAARAWFTGLKDLVAAKLGEVWGKVAAWFTEKAGAVGEKLAGVWTTVSGWFAEKATAVGTWFAERGTAIGTWFTELPGKIGGWLTDVATTAGKWLSEKASAVGTWLANLLKGIANFYISLPGKVWTWLGQIASKTKKFMADRLAALGTKLAEALTTVKNWVTGIPARLTEWFKSVVTRAREKGSETIAGLKDGVTGKWEDVKAWFGGLAERVRTAIGNALTFLKEKGKNLLQGLKDGITGKWDEVKSWVSGIGSRVLNAIGDLGRTLWNHGWGLISGFFGGLVAKWNDVAEWVSSRAQWIADHKGPIEKDRRLLVPAGNAIMEGLAEGLKNGFRPVEKLVEGMGGDLRDAFGGPQFRVGVSGAVVAPSMWGASVAASLSEDMAGGSMNESTTVINMNLQGKDLQDIRSISDFVDMAQVRARMAGAR